MAFYFLLVKLLLLTNLYQASLDPDLMNQCCLKEEMYAEVKITTAVYLQGALDEELGVMSTRLRDLGYLPGQKPKAFFAQPTQAGQPYKESPWQYGGKEGHLKSGNLFEYPLGTVDWVLVSLRAEDSIETDIYKASGYLLKDGTIAISKDAPACLLDPSQKYYVVIQHRNHLAVMSDRPVSIKEGVVHFDFRFSPSYLEGQVEFGKGKYAMIAGNAKKAHSISDHRFIDEEDVKSWEAANGMNSSYFQMDVDLSGDVSIKDQEIIYNNLGRFSTVPF